MGTKNNPGEFDCYANAEPDEPMFVLLGRDSLAPELVARWAREHHKESVIAAYKAGKDGAEVGMSDKEEEALNCADAMVAWRKHLELGGD